MTKIDQHINYAQHRMTQIMKTQSSRNIDYRRARTRTLIALGGLLEKSGLTDLVGIELGQDLQKDETCFESVTMLLGGLFELKNYWKYDDFEQQKQLWLERGKQAMKK